MTTKHFLYHHRTQGGGVEGVHIRGMIDGFRRCGYAADIVGPPGTDPYSVQAPSGGHKAARSLLRCLWQRIGEKVPEVLFELLEFCYNFYALPTLWLRIRRGSYSFIYERYALNTFATALLARWTGLPLVLEVNDATVIHRSRRLTLKRIARFVEGVVFSRANMIITISEHFKELIIAQYSVPQDKMLVLPNAIDPNRFQLQPEKRVPKGKLSIQDGQIVIGCVGAFVPWHGLEFLVESAADLCQKHDLFFLFIGDGPVRANVEKLAQRCGIGGRAAFTGFISSDDVPYYLDLVDVCVIPGSNEHCSPMKLFEYLAMGKPVVVPRYKSLQEVLEDGVDGLFFTPNEAAALRSALLRMLTDADARAAFGEAGLSKVLKSFTWEKNAQRVLAVM